MKANLNVPSDDRSSVEQDLRKIEQKVAFLTQQQQKQQDVTQLKRENEILKQTVQQLEFRLSQLELKGSSNYQPEPKQQEVLIPQQPTFSMRPDLLSVRPQHGYELNVPIQFTDSQSGKLDQKRDQPFAPGKDPEPKALGLPQSAKSRQFQTRRK